MRRTLCMLLAIALVQQGSLWAQLPVQAGGIGAVAVSAIGGMAMTDDLIGRRSLRSLERYVHKKATKIGDQLRRQTEKELKKLRRLETGITRRLCRLDSTYTLLAGFYTDSTYAAYLRQPGVELPAAGTRYLPNLDSLQTALQFLNGQKDKFSVSEAGQVAVALQQVQGLRDELEHAEGLIAFMRQRKEMVQGVMNRYMHLPEGISRRYQKLQLEAFYYTREVEGYRELLDVPDKLLSAALEKLMQLPAFLRFMAQNSELAGLFRLPAGYGSATVSGLQTRNEIQQLIETQLAGAGPNAQQLLQQNIQVARGQLQQVKEKLEKWGIGGADLEMPNFKPNTLRRKTFWKRLEYGANLQSARSNAFFPTTTDMGLSAGYRINDKSIVGIGASYKLGWGKDIRQIKLTNAGASVRSYLDVRVKASFYLSGGFEYNYQPLADARGLTTQQQLQADSWQHSGLIGVSKIVAVNHKFFRKTKVQLLWDFLSYRQTPRAQAIKFRVGYNF
ncbi:hypothetical protein [Paraflavitalea sp. CAU 1676]|uniref:hypothetical protein n=1 Tax=Paraflavitalea sp. CAU 1676 TaxID=3032598 RepID=UPI0023DA45F8|nr:hypothetical protein [Paraflavitalea sp. CAU 1676]MDF2191499.1 hypothetical protein [Paraflavitalea sp. CAU 1676]